tara:strand:- start:709 stop:921 length:213 start_codon:yes stop_codon:yes gene_type:complete
MNNFNKNECEDGCRFDLTWGVCLKCFRTPQEVVSWDSMGETYQKGMEAVLEHRKEDFWYIFENIGPTTLH